MLWSENLIINDEVNIPANDKTNFIFEKYWNSSIFIGFDTNNVNTENLFIIIQSYLWNNQFRAIKVYTCQKKIYEKGHILSYSNVFLVKKMNYLYFLEWWEERLEYDKKYISENSIYGILIVFAKNNTNSNISYEKLRPKYPWNNAIKNYFLFFK
jgi:hypothetical protein